MISIQNYKTVFDIEEFNKELLAFSTVYQQIS